MWFDSPIVIDNSGMTTVSCDYESGDRFWLGEHEVWCEVKDVHQNQAHCSFYVTVVGECINAFHAAGECRRQKFNNICKKKCGIS